MYEIIKNVITAGRYELADMLHKIDTIWLQGGITDEERQELIGLARTNASPENSYASIQKQVDNLYVNMAELAAALKDITGRVTVLEGGTVEEPTQEEYPAWKQPTGAHDAYNVGDKMTYTDGKRYICQMDGCVWGPDVYPDGWAVVEEEIVEKE